MDEIRRCIVIDLKIRAKEDIHSNKEQALAWLKQAKQIETGNNLALELKKLAVYFKKGGDIEGAKSALLKSKEVEQLQRKEVCLDAPVTLLAEKEDINGAKSNPNKDKVLRKEEKIYDDSQILKESDESDLLNDLTDEEDNNDTPILVIFTDEEMMDEEIMTELHLEGMPVPSQDKYSEKVLKYKQNALAWKQKGDIPAASAELRKAKQLQKVQQKLKGMEDGLGLRVNGDLDGWAETLSAEESALLGELLMTSTTTTQNLTDAEDVGGLYQQARDIEIKDLEGMDDSDIREFIEMGMTLPSEEELIRNSIEKQREAVEFKQVGNIDMAKAALLESKKIKIIADRLKKIRNNADDESDEEINQNGLDALLSGDAVKKSAVKQKPPPAAEDPWLSQPSGKIKEEVIRLKEMKNLKEARRLLGVYKQVLKTEERAKEAILRKELVEKIKTQIAISEKQKQLYSFYIRFVDRDIGEEQFSKWDTYMESCHQAIAQIERKGSSAVRVSIDKDSKLIVLEDDIVGLIENETILPLNGLLEISILQVLNLHENKTMQRFMLKYKDLMIDELCPELEVDVKINLPITEQSQQTLTFHPSVSKRHNDDKGSLRYLFTDSQSIDVPRGESRQAKAIVRKMQTKKIQISISAKPPQKRKGGLSRLFSGVSHQESSAANESSVSLGRVTFELNDLLKRNCIAGDFPITLNSKDVGGYIRLCMRTDQAFDPSQFEELLVENQMTQFDMALLFSEVSS